MKRILYLNLFVASLFIACTQEFQPKGIKHVVIIGIDGMSVGGVMEANTPNFDSYIEDGVHSYHARDILPTVSSPNWAAMLTGSTAAQTGVASNGWEIDDYRLPPVLTTENGRYPDIFYVLKKNKAELKTASVYDWGDFGRLYDNTFVDIDIDPKGAEKTAKTAAEVLKNDKPDFLFVHLDHVDHAGHADGHMTPGYLKAVELADSLSAVIIDAAKEAGTFDETLFIIVADHGGVGYGHGDLTIQGNEVPFIMYGAGLKNNYELPVQVNVMDIPSTVAYVFGVPIPQAWVGRPITCAFEGAPEPDPATLVGQFLEPSTYVPVILPRKPNGESGGLFVGKKAIVTIESKGENGEIRYTTDGSIPTRKSTLYSDPFEMKESGAVKAIFFGNKGGQTAYSEGYFRVINNVTPQTGVNYKLYKGNDWAKLPDFKLLKPVESGRVYEFSTDELADKISDFTALVFEGYIQIAKDGKYVFATQSDDGSKLYVNDKLVVNNDGDHGIQEQQGSVNLKSGKNKIKMEYFNGGGGYYLSATYQGSETPTQIISPEVLTVR